MSIRRRIRWLVLITLTVILLTPAIALAALRWINPPTSAYMLRAGVNADNRPLHYRWTDLDDIATCMPLAVVAAEDQTFPTNHGFAWGAIKDAVVHDLNGGHLRGASTITQQTAKNLFLWPARSFLRKGVEAYITAWMAGLWPKRRVMSVYLNIAQFDDRIFGVGAAARRIYGVKPSGLSRLQCARLAAVLPAPKRYSAAHPGPYVARHARWIQGQMDNLGPHYLDRALAR